MGNPKYVHRTFKYVIQQCINAVLHSAGQWCQYVIHFNPTEPSLSLRYVIYQISHADVDVDPSYQVSWMKTITCHIWKIMKSVHISFHHIHVISASLATAQLCSVFCSVGGKWKIYLDKVSNIWPKLRKLKKSPIWPQITFWRNILRNAVWSNQDNCLSKLSHSLIHSNLFNLKRFNRRRSF